MQGGNRRSLKCSEIGNGKGTSHQHHQFRMPILQVVANDDDDGQRAFQDQEFPTTLEDDAILSAMDEHEQSPLLFGGTTVAAAFDESSSTSGHSSSDDSGNYSPTTISNGSSVFTECISPLSDGLLLNGKDCSIYSTTPSSQHQLQQREWTVDESAPLFDPFDCNNTVVDDYHLEDVASVLMEDGFLEEYGNDESYLGEAEEAEFVVQQQELQQQQFNQVGRVHGLQMEYNDSNGSLPQHHQQQQHWASPQLQQSTQGQCQGQTPILPSTSFIYKAAQPQFVIVDQNPTRNNYNNIQSQPQHGHNLQPQHGHNHRQFQAVDRNNHNNLSQHDHNQFQATAVVDGNGQQQQKQQQQFVNTAQFLPAAATTSSPSSKLLVLLKPPAPSVQTLQQQQHSISNSSPINNNGIVDRKCSLPFKIEPIHAPSHQHHQQLVSHLTPLLTTPQFIVTQNGIPRPRRSPPAAVVDNDFVQKMEDRKLRNRASAQMSRQRKKEEIDRIRVELDEAHKRCEHLETENRQLHATVRQLEAELSKHRGGQPDDPSSRDEVTVQQQSATKPTSTKNANAKSSNDSNSKGRRPAAAAKTTAGVCMFVLLSWVAIFPPGTIPPATEKLLESDSRFLLTGNNNGTELISHPHHSHGRALVDTADGLNSSISSRLATNQTTTFINGTIAASSIGNCGGVVGHFRLHNATQSLKLSEELYTWIARHEKMELVQLRRGQLPPSFGAVATGHVPPLPKLRINSTDFEAADEKAPPSTIKRGRTKKLGATPTTSSSSSSSSTADPAHAASAAAAASPSTNSRLIRRDLRRFFSLANRSKRGGISNDNNGDVHHQSASKLLPTPTQQMNVQQMLKLVQGIRRGGGHHGSGNDDNNNNHSDSDDDNTLYVIPLHDYFLLPPPNLFGGAGRRNGGNASSGNSSSSERLPPKMSIILPALAPPTATNSTGTEKEGAKTTPPFNQLSMMRIECEVIGTNVFFLPEGLVKSLSSSMHQQATDAPTAA